MLVILWTFLILCGFFNKKSKKLVIAQIIFASIMLATNTGNPDYQNGVDFQAIRDSVLNIFHGNILYNVLFWVWGKFTSYDIAVFFISLCSYIFIYKTIIYYTDKTAFVLSLYLISPFVIDATQLKNFVAMSFWLYSTKYLYEIYKDNNKKSIIKYILCCVVATGIHFSFAFTFVYLMIIFLKNKDLISIVKVLTLITVIYYLLNHYLSDILMAVSDRVTGPLSLIAFKINAYAMNYNTEQAKLRFLITIVFYFFVLTALICIRYFASKKVVNRDENIQLYYQYTVRLIAISAFCLPFILMSMEMYRMQRNILIVIYIFIAMVVSNNVVVNNKMKINSFLSLIIGICIAFLYLLSDSIIWNYDTVFRSLFRL